MTNFAFPKGQRPMMTLRRVVIITMGIRRVVFTRPCDWRRLSPNSTELMKTLLLLCGFKAVGGDFVALDGEAVKRFLGNGMSLSCFNFLRKVR